MAIQHMTDFDAEALRKQCQATWDRDPAIRTEFRNFDTYFAYEKAKAEGRTSGWSAGAGRR